MKRILIVTLLLVAAGALIFAGGKKDAGREPGVRVIRVGTEGAYPPYNFVDASGKADGYDIAVIRAVDELLPEYTFEFVPTAWDGIFVALEAGEFDLIASNLGWRQEREEKYWLSTVPYLWGTGNTIVFKGGRTDIKSIEDLNNKKVAAGVGTSTTTWLEQYIARTGIKVEIVYTDGNIVSALTEIDSGRVDATLASPITTQLTAEQLGFNIKSITIANDDPSHIHLLFPKTDTGKKLRDDIDVALQKLHDNGTLSSLSKKYFFGVDYTTKEVVQKK
ncbi:amino acid ABC transporter substrate-binding protein [Spirochaetia bacterium]|nr:amino acid ABC transporter substrate-binding protein [Spirochaetia bacterium]